MERVFLDIENTGGPHFYLALFLIWLHLGFISWSNYYPIFVDQNMAGLQWKKYQFG